MVGAWRLGEYTLFDSIDLSTSRTGRLRAVSPEEVYWGGHGRACMERYERYNMVTTRAPMRRRKSVLKKLKSPLFGTALELPTAVSEVN